ARFGRRWKTIRRPPSRKSHDAARAGRTLSPGSYAVRPSNSWLITIELPRSPSTAGSSVVGSPTTSVAEVFDDAYGGAVPAVGPAGACATATAPIARTNAAARRIAASRPRKRTTGLRRPVPAPPLVAQPAALPRTTSPTAAFRPRATAVGRTAARWEQVAATVRATRSPGS